MRQIVCVAVAISFILSTSADAMGRHRKGHHTIHSGVHSHRAPRASAIRKRILQGVASWYGDHERGRKTSNGERFDPSAMTCAHRTLPMNSLLQVTNLETGKSAVVRVNDRGPYVGHRIIDLSQKAAQVLGFAGDGLAMVAITVLQTGPLPKQYAAIAQTN